MKSEKLLVKFNKPYKFEEQTYNEIDLSGIEKLKGIDLISCQNEITNSGKIIPVFETDIEYLFLIASRATGKPKEFFNNLPIDYATMVKNRVSSFLLVTV